MGKHGEEENLGLPGKMQATTQTMAGTHDHVTLAKFCSFSGRKLLHQFISHMRIVPHFPRNARTRTYPLSARSLWTLLLLWTFSTTFKYRCVELDTFFWTRYLAATGIHSNQFCRRQTTWGKCSRHERLINGWLFNLFSKVGRGFGARACLRFMTSSSFCLSSTRVTSLSHLIQIIWT